MLTADAEEIQFSHLDFLKNVKLIYSCCFLYRIMFPKPYGKSLDFRGAFGKEISLSANY